MLTSIFRLPNCLSSSVLNEWLDLKCVVRLDSAICCHISRNNWLTLLHSPEFVCYNVNGSKSLQWALSRQVKASTLFLTANFRVDALLFSNYLRDNEHHVRRAFIHTRKLADRGVLSHVARCGHLKILKYTANLPSDNELLFVLLCKNRNLEELHIKSLRRHTFSNQFAALTLPKLSVLSCEICDCLLPLFCNSVRRLNVVINENYPVPHDMINKVAADCLLLRSLRCTPHFLPFFLAKCPHIVNLQVTDCENIKDEHIRQIVQTLPNLRALDLSHSSSFQTQRALEYIVQHCGPTLEILHILILSKESPLTPAMLLRLPKLHTFRWYTSFCAHVCSIVYQPNHITVIAPGSVDPRYFESLPELERLDVLEFSEDQHMYTLNFPEMCKTLVPFLIALKVKYPMFRTICVNKQYLEAARATFSVLNEVTVTCKRADHTMDLLKLPI